MDPNTGSASASGTELLPLRAKMDATFSRAVTLIASRPPHPALASTLDVEALAQNRLFMQDVSTAIGGQIDAFVSAADTLQARLTALPAQHAPSTSTSASASAAETIARLERAVLACDRELAEKALLVSAAARRLATAEDALAAVAGDNAAVQEGLYSSSSVPAAAADAAGANGYDDADVDADGTSADAGANANEDAGQQPQVMGDGLGNDDDDDDEFSDGES
jgi:hypothetical protein